MSRELNDLEPKTRELCVRLLQECEKAGHPIIVTHTYRSMEEQEALYARGRSRPGPVITNARAGDSWHNYRRAFDIVFIQGTQISWTGPWEEVGRIGESLGLAWGGRFHSFPDRPHFEYHPQLTLADMQRRTMVVRADIPTTDAPLEEEKRA